MALSNTKGVLLQERQQNNTLGELLSQIASQSAALVRDEIELVKREFQEKAFTLRPTLVVIGVGSILGFFSIQLLVGAALIALAEQFGWLKATLLLALLAALVSSGMIGLGVIHLKRIFSESRRTLEEQNPQWSLEILKEDKP
jgi:hypothetical protein